MKQVQYRIVEETHCNEKCIDNWTKYFVEEQCKFLWWKCWKRHSITTEFTTMDGYSTDYRITPKEFETYTAATKYIESLIKGKQPNSTQTKRVMYETFTESN